MTNIKKLASGLLVAVLAFGFSAFKNTEKTDQTKLAPFYYGLDATDDVYRIITGSPVFEECTPGAPKDCVLISPTTDFGPDLDANEEAQLSPAEESSPEAYYFN
ncbi:hypothetical protein [Pedobacter nyackensis]|uniref:NVEALA protein n=1 Tax=Pedobacter nyackensis TaxID=475255 RepID=A0A1W2DV75_9SPHI|nr:hypothetical protein [Pedobacter nyackensis]SMD01319.1 hypothetical protein SAMN04488101_108163 [Pedobacter nyackensis]